MAEKSQLSAQEIEYIQTNFRIPVDSTWPGTYWIVSLDRVSLMPTDEELGMIASYCAFVVQNIYNEHYQRLIMARDFPKEASHNTAIFRKGSPIRDGMERHWFYRQISWESGPAYFPDARMDEYKGYSLLRIMDHIQKLVPNPWIAWKNYRPMIFEPQIGGE
jgi:hypothetical protein